MIIIETGFVAFGLGGTIGVMCTTFLAFLEWGLEGEWPAADLVVQLLGCLITFGGLSGLLLFWAAR